MWRPSLRREVFSIYFSVRDNLRAVATVNSEELRRTRVDIEYRREIRRATNGANIDMTPGTKLCFVLFCISVLSLDIPTVLSD